MHPVLISLDILRRETSSFVQSLHGAGSLNLLTFILTISLGLSPPDRSTFTRPVVAAPFTSPLGSTLCLLNGLSSPSPCSFLFLLLPFLNLARTSEGSLSLTILLLLGLAWLCLGGAGVDRGAGVAAADLGAETGAATGRGGGMFGRDGAGVEGRELGAEEPVTVLVLILILGPEEGIGECMGDGAVITFGMFTGGGFGRGGAGAGTGLAATADAEAGVCEAVGSGTGVFKTGARVGTSFGGETAGGLEGLGGSTGDSRLITIGCGAGDGLREAGADIGAGEACLIGGENVG